MEQIQNYREFVKAKIKSFRKHVFCHRQRLRQSRITGGDRMNGCDLMEEIARLKLGGRS